MAAKKRAIPTDEKLTFAQARARLRKLKLKPPPAVEGKGSGAAVPYNQFSKAPRVKP